MKMYKNPERGSSAIIEALQEISMYITQFEEENKKCVSYYMLAHSFEEKV